MNILRIIGSTDPASGGPVEALKRSTQALQVLGHHTEIVCLDPPDAPWLNTFDIPVHALRQFGGRYRFSWPFTSWIAGNAHRFDVAVVHGVWNFSSLGAHAALKGSGLPYVVFTHGMLDPWFREAFPLKHLAKDLYWYLFEKRVLAHAACVFFTSEDERRLARSLYSHAAYSDAVVPYGTADAPRPTRLGSQQMWPELVGRRYLLFLSRLHPKKGCDLAIRAFAATAAQWPDLDLVMAGPDEIGWIPELQRLAEKLGVADRVHWTGMLTGDRKWAALRGAEAFLLPSHSENFGVVIAEALACGTPVLITNKVNIWREIVVSEAGWAVEDDEPGVSEMVARYLRTSASDRLRMRTAARTCFLEKFDIHRSAEVLAGHLARAAAMKVVV